MNCVLVLAVQRPAYNIITIANTYGLFSITMQCGQSQALPYLFAENAWNEGDQALF